MHASQLEVIHARLTRLERHYRRWQVLGSLALLALLLVLLSGASEGRNVKGAREIRARQFVLVDERGAPLARLGRLHHGGIGLGFYEQGDKSRILLSIDDDGSASLSLFGKNGKGSALFTAGRQGTAGLRLLDRNWKVRASLATWPDGSPFLQLSDDRGQDRVILGYTELIITSMGKIVKRPTSSLVLLDEDETVIWRAP